MKITLKVAFLALFCLSSSLHAAEISAAQAQKAASNWIARKGHPLGTRLDSPVVKVNTVSNQDGSPRLHLITLKEGFVVTSADDRLMPLVAFSSGTFDLGEKSPLLALLDRDLSARIAGLSATPQIWTVSLRTPAQEAWAELLNDHPVSVQGFSAVEDIRVAPLLSSKWGQEGGIYNARTPNGYPSGCVATAMVQVMRYHEFPVAAVTPITDLCWIDGVETALTMTGGVYDWSAMPFGPYPDFGSADTIGTLLADAGIALQMAYEPDGSAASQALIAHALPNYFGYASAKSLAVQNGTLSETVIEKTLLANLDAKLPVVVGLSGDGGGHTVVGDGYGYDNGVRYVHLNMGWDGLDDVWYNLPDVDATLGFDLFDEVAYNIFPETTGEIISGRVLFNGDPVDGVTVTAANSKKQSYTAVTDAKGVYAVIVPSPASAENYTVSVRNVSGAVSSRSVSVAKTKTQDLVFESGQFIGWRDWGTSGNVYGVELEMPSGDATGLTLSARSLAALTAGGEFMLDVVSDGNWVVDASAWWIRLETVSDTGDDQVMFSVAPNTTGLMRSATLTVRGGNLAAECEIRQTSLPWSDNASDAFAEASGPQKRILLFTGDHSSVTNVLCMADACEEAGVKPLLAEHYALWYAVPGASDASPYIADLALEPDFPAWVIIDPVTETRIDSRIGPMSPEALFAWAEEKRAPFTALTISGLSTLPAGAVSVYTAETVYGNYPVTVPVGWSIEGGASNAFINVDGVLTTYPAAGGSRVKILASHVDNAGVEQNTEFEVTIQAAAGFTFLSETVQVEEGAVLSLPVYGGAADTASSVKFWIFPGTAGTTDYTLPKPYPGVLTWESGEIGEKTIEIPIKADKTVEADEFFTVVLGAPAGCGLGDVTTATVIIRDANSAETLQSALNCSALSWSTSGNAKFEVQRLVSRDGAALRARPLAPGQTSIVQTSIRQSGTLSAWFRIDGDAEGSVLELWDGKTLLASWDAFTSGDWFETSGSFGSGSHTLKWVFVRGSGEDVAVYMDQAFFAPSDVWVFYVDATASDPAGGTVLGSGWYPQGAKVTLSAKPRPGWTFTGWEGAEFAKPLAVSQSFTVGEDVSVTAKFEKQPFVRGLPLPADGGTVSGSALCTPGKTLTLSAKPAKNFTFEGWSDGVVTASRKVSGVEEDVTLTALFKPYPKLNVAVVPAEGGKVTGAGSYAPEKKVTLKASPTKGYAFMGWGHGDQQPSLAVVTTDADQAFTAHFKAIAEIPAPVISAVADQEAMVGLPFALDLSVASETLPTVTVSGLPSGVKFDKTTLSLAGIPTKAGSFSVKVKATNITKQAVEAVFTLTVSPLFPWAVGSFSGLSEPDAIKDTGRVEFTVSATGAVSGSLETLAGKYTFKTTLRIEEETLGFAAEISRGRNREPLALDMSFNGGDPESSSVAGSVFDPETAASADVTVWQDLIKLAPEAFAGWVGTYNVALESDVFSGYGYFTLTVKAKSSKATLAGRLPDNQTFSASSLIVPLQDGALLVPIWVCGKKTGMILTGWLEIGSDGIVSPDSELYCLPREVAETGQGYFGYFVHHTGPMPPRDWIYDSVDETGFYSGLIMNFSAIPVEPTYNITPFGGRYVAPVSDWAVSLPEGIALQAVWRGENPAAETVTFTFKRDAASALADSLPENAKTLTLSIPRKTGLFSGKVTFLDRKSLSYWGILTPDSECMGGGYIYDAATGWFDVVVLEE